MSVSDQVQHNPEQNRTEQKIYLLSNIARVNISSEELVFRQTNV